MGEVEEPTGEKILIPSDILETNPAKLRRPEEPSPREKCQESNRPMAETSNEYSKGPSHPRARRFYKTKASREMLSRAPCHGGVVFFSLLFPISEANGLPIAFLSRI